MTTSHWMDTQTLEIYLGLCRNLHFSKTSEQFHLSPSALSRAIQRLEQEVGCALLLRDNRTVTLTPQGELFRQYAEDVVARGEQLQVELGASLQRLSGKLSLFASVTASQSILPRVLARFRREYPLVEIQLETGYAVNALQRLQEGCDVVVAALAESGDPLLTQRIIMAIPMLTIAPVDSQLGQGESIDWSSVPLVLPTSGQARSHIDDWLRELRIKPKIYSEVAGNEAILSLVALGCGVGFVPALVLENSPLADRVKILAGGPLLTDIHVGFCTRSKSLLISPLVQAFWQSI
jgi:LysR family transcriptional regulator, positive regulator for ilvC